MVIKINKEFRDFSETIYFGLNLRQLLCSACAVGVAVGSYFLLKPYLGTETLSWLCIVLAAPFAAMGFIKYNGMPAEKFAWAWIKYKILLPKRLVFKGMTETELINQEKECKDEKHSKRKHKG